MRITASVVTFCAALTTLGCGSDADTATPAPPASIRVLAGNHQTGDLGSALDDSIAVRVEDASGHGVAGIVVTFSVVAGGGSLQPATDTTNSDGMAKAQFILGTRLDSAQRGEATVAGLEKAVVIALAQLPTSAVLSVLSGNSQTDTVAQQLPESLAVRIALNDGRPLQGVTIDWTVTSGYGTALTSSSSDDEGRATNRWILGSTAGTQTVTARAGPLATVTLTAVALPGPPERVLTYHGSSQRAWPGDTLTDSLVAQLVDFYGNGIPGKAVQWKLMTGGGTLSHGAAITGAGGLASAQLRLGPDLGANWSTAAVGVLPAAEFYDTAAVTYAKIDAGLHHTCGVATDNSVFCWGMNDRGQLGNDSGFAGGLSCSSACSLWPTRVSGGLKFATVTAGGQHTCGLTSSGEAWCWGDNGYGQVTGDGSSLVQFTSLPVRVPGGHIFSTLSAGDHHTCGIATDGNAYCWGWNLDGQLGDSSTNTFRRVVRVARSISFSVISAGDRHTCGVATSGAAYCWGWNVYGQLGVGTLQSDSAPAALGGILFSTISAGEYHSCGVGSNGAAYCWGYNNFGQLGHGDTDPALTPQRVLGLQTYTAISASLQPLTCALAISASVYCWGSDNQGQTGRGGSPTPPHIVSIPVAVAGGFTSTLVTAGAQHACALGSDAIVRCWGAGYLGQIGEATISGSSSPRRVAFQK